MTRKDYEKLARGIKKVVVIARKSNDPNYTQGVSHAIYAIQDELEADNPRFNRERFLQACGLGVE